MALSTRLLLLLGFTCPALAFSNPASFSASNTGRFEIVKNIAPLAANSNVFAMRGGDQEDLPEENKPNMSGGVTLPGVSVLASLGQTYAKSLDTNPIVTKSVTACFIFGLSDWVAQRLSTTDKKEDNKYDLKRTITSSLVGLLYFGPAAHAWYYHIFRLFPGTGLAGTVQKAVMGQLLFGPSFTCIFFATALMNSGNFSLGSWWNKIRTDLPGAWAAGLGFWPFVDLVSYSLIAPQWIPLFVNTCSFIWTIYLSIVSNRNSKKSD